MCMQDSRGDPGLGRMPWVPLGNSVCSGLPSSPLLDDGFGRTGGTCHRLMFPQTQPDRASGTRDRLLELQAAWLPPSTPMLALHLLEAPAGLGAGQRAQECSPGMQV